MNTFIMILLKDCSNHGLDTTVVGESEVCQMKSFQINQVFVYDLFDGPAFQHVLIAAKQNKAVLVFIFFLLM